MYKSKPSSQEVSYLAEMNGGKRTEKEGRMEGYKQERKYGSKEARMQRM